MKIEIDIYQVNGCVCMRAVIPPEHGFCTARELAAAKMVMDAISQLPPLPGNTKHNVVKDDFQVTTVGRG